MNSLCETCRIRPPDKAGCGLQIIGYEMNGKTGIDVVIGKMSETGGDFMVINCTIKDKAGHKE